MPRKMTWAILIWTGFFILWAYGGLSGVAPCANSDSGCQAGTAIGGALAVSFLFFLWIVGFIVLSIVWFMTRPKSNVTVYGPSGITVLLSESDAAKRVQMPGWSYTPTAGPPSSIG